MIEAIKNTNLYNSLGLNKNLSQAYIFYSNDKILNNNIALLFAKSLLCENKTACGHCDFCKQFDNLSNPDLMIINQDSIKVEDANKIISKLATKPISNKYKIFVILNAENMNETAQNKLLKSFEEPNENNIFILSASKIDKVLPTILSRLKKIYVPKLEFDDKLILRPFLLKQGVDISPILNLDLNLTETINMVSDKNYINTFETIKQVLTELKSSQDIPIVVSKMKDFDKDLFFPMLQDIFLNCLNKTNKYDEKLTTFIKVNYSPIAISKIVEIIENAYKKQTSNVNFSYLVDLVLFNILKEKYLCK